MQHFMSACVAEHCGLDLRQQIPASPLELDTLALLKVLEPEKYGVLLIPRLPSKHLPYCPDIKYLASF